VASALYHFAGSIHPDLALRAELQMGTEAISGTRLGPRVWRR
jgi:hypothetical protein